MKLMFARSIQLKTVNKLKKAGFTAKLIGKKVKIEYRSSLDKTVKDILGGIRSSCTYVGAPTLKQLSKCTTFVRVNNQYNDVFGRI